MKTALINGLSLQRGRGIDLPLQLDRGAGPQETRQQRSAKLAAVAARFRSACMWLLGCSQGDRWNTARSSAATQRVNILGVGVSAVNIPHTVVTIDRWIARHEQHYVCVTGVHGIVESQRDEHLRQIHNRAGLVTPDGMPLVWLSHLGGFRHVDRVCGYDLVAALCEHSVSRGYRHYLYGGADGVAERLGARLRERFPGLQIVGSYCPPFRQMSPEEDERVVADINEASPDIVWVGLSTPKQEKWMATHLGRLDAPVMLGVGAAFDFHAGLKRRAPFWMQRCGLEWLFRLLLEPRRLALRYLHSNPLFVVLALAQLFGVRRYRLHPENVYPLSPEELTGPLFSSQSVY